jgi:hypothetical protein
MVTGRSGGRRFESSQVVPASSNTNRSTIIGGPVINLGY